MVNSTCASARAVVTGAWWEASVSDISKTPIGIGIFMFAVSVGTLCGPPKNTTTTNEHPRYWYCSSVVASQGQDQGAILYSNAIFAGDFAYYAVRDGYRAFVKKSTNSEVSGAAGCTSHPSLVSAQAALNEKVKSFDTESRDQPHEIRNTEWIYRLRDENENK
jgi:hypothetical protein